MHVLYNISAPQTRINLSFALFLGPKGPPRFFEREKEVATGARIFMKLFSGFYTYKSPVSRAVINFLRKNQYMTRPTITVS